MQKELCTNTNVLPGKSGGFKMFNLSGFFLFLVNELLIVYCGVQCSLTCIGEGCNELCMHTNLAEHRPLSEILR